MSFVKLSLISSMNNTLTQLLFLLQLEEYDTKRLLLWIKTNPDFQIKQDKKKLVWTIKAKVLYCLARFMTLLGVKPLKALVLATKTLLPLEGIFKNFIIALAKFKLVVCPNLVIIGITGSYGKTTVKEILSHLLETDYRVLKTPENYNTPLGIAKIILTKLNAQHQIFIVEMGAYNIGGIKLLCDIAKPKIGILTGINEQHMATFGSQENIIKAKYELIESLPKDGVAFFNAKNKYCRNLYEKTGIKKELYGEKAVAPGEENILGAMAVAKELGTTEEEISKAVSKIENKLGGIQIKKGINGLNIVDATYSANPDGVIAHLEYLKTLPGRKVIAMPCLIELGWASKEVHRRIGQKIGEVCDLAIITTKDRLKEIKEGAGEKALFIEDPKEIFEKIKEFCEPGDVILLESRVPSRLIQQLTINSQQ